MVKNIGPTSSSVVAVVALTFVSVGCSAEDAETIYPDDTEFGPADIEIDDVEVEDGTEGGLDLDNGNVEGSTSDAELDPFDEENDLNS